MKKLVSLLSAVAMLAMLAVPASAALNYAADDDGWYVISELPSDAEIAAYEPTLNVTTAKLETEEDLKAVSSAVNKKYKGKLATHDIYKITYDVANLGAFVNGYDEDYNNSYFGLYDITIGFDAAGLPADYEVYALNYTLPDGATGAVGVGVDKGTGYLNAAYTAPGTAFDKVFPARTNDEGIVVTAGTYKAEYILLYPTTTEAVTLPLASSTVVTYQRDLVAVENKKMTADAIVLGAVEPEPDPEPAVTEVVVSDTIDLQADDVIGAAWDVTIKNFDSAKKYVTTFTDKDTAEVRENGYKELNLDAYAETEGDLGFAVILKLNAARNVALSIAIQ